MSVIDLSDVPILVLMCGDGRNHLPIPKGVNRSEVHQLRGVGGFLAPALMPDLSVEERALLGQFYVFQVKTMIRLKKPKFVVVCAHSDCGAAKALGLDDSALHDELAAFVEDLSTDLATSDINIPVYGMFDDHCYAGMVRTLKLVCAVVTPPDVASVRAA